MPLARVLLLLCLAGCRSQGPGAAHPSPRRASPQDAGALPVRVEFPSSWPEQATVEISAYRRGAAFPHRVLRVSRRAWQLLEASGDSGRDYRTIARGEVEPSGRALGVPSDAFLDPARLVSWSPEAGVRVWVRGEAVPVERRRNVPI